MGFDLYSLGNHKTDKANTLETMFGGGDDLLTLYVNTRELLMKKINPNGNQMVDMRSAKNKLNKLPYN